MSIWQPIDMNMMTCLLQTAEILTKGSISWTDVGPQPVLMNGQQKYHHYDLKTL